MSLEDKLKKVPSINCVVEKKGKYSEYFKPEDIEQIKKQELDVLIRFSFNIIKGDILTAAKKGVWSYHHGDESAFRGGPPGFWEIYYNHHSTGVILQQLTDELDNGIVLKKGFYKTIKKSYPDNLNTILFESSGWIKQVCIDLINNLDTPKHKASSTAPIKKAPHNAEMISFFIKKSFHSFLFHYRELFSAEKWNIGLAKGTPEDFLEKGIENEKWLPELRRGEYRADPFGYLFNDHLCIIHEKYDYSLQKGWIEIQRSNEESYTAIDSTKHLSYPYIFNYNKECYCVPETYQKNCIELYKLSKSNNQWVLDKSLLENIHAVDSSLIFYNKKWWLFCTREDRNPNTNLYLFYSDSLSNKFVAHKNNPVKTNIHSARPAGNIFIIDNVIYRPSQDCSKSYGCKLVINKIDKLSETEFAESIVKTIEPKKSWNFNRGIHTINFVSNHVIFDAKKYEFNFPNFRAKLRKKLRSNSN